ncbi:MAG: hypothetical protein F6K35_23600, partial [Okeania sp. SIO2H7]|nr:hypothetical protein [Okeania sp. SIO2H7]
AIETKSKQYSIDTGLPQLLFYMLSNPVAEIPTFGLLTNGRNFQFVKVMEGEKREYALSYDLSINRNDDFYYVFRVLKRLGYLVSNNGVSWADESNNLEP